MRKVTAIYRKVRLEMDCASAE